MPAYVLQLDYSYRATIGPNVTAIPEFPKNLHAVGTTKALARKAVHAKMAEVPTTTELGRDLSAHAQSHQNSRNTLATRFDQKLEATNKALRDLDRKVDTLLRTKLDALPEDTKEIVLPELKVWLEGEVTRRLDDLKAELLEEIEKHHG